MKASTYAEQKVAERTRMRNVLHQEKEFSEGLWEHAQAIILVLDVRGCIIRYNPYLEDLTGIPHREVKGLDWFERFVPERERERQRDIFEETVRSDTSAAISSLLTESGRERRISWSNKSLKNMAGRAVAMLAVGQDITELNQAQQRALQAERLAGIGQMITGLAHESRNALQRIQACAEMLELEVEGNGEALDLVHRIKLAQDHMHRLFDEVRGYAAPVNLDRSACQLGSVWREAWELLLPQWEGRIAEMIARTDGAELGFYGDHFRLVQLFRILFENSLAACPDPVRIEITCRPATLGNATGIRVSVRDNGAGLNQEQREALVRAVLYDEDQGYGPGAGHRPAHCRSPRRTDHRRGRLPARRGDCGYASLCGTGMNHRRYWNGRTDRVRLESPHPQGLLAVRSSVSSSPTLTRANRGEDMSDVPPTTEESTTEEQGPCTAPHPAKETSPLRLIVLLLVFGVALAGLLYDYTIARPAIKKADQTIQGLLEGSIKDPSGDGAVTEDEVQSLLGSKPSSVTQLENGKIEVYSWRSGLPYRTYDLYVVYSGQKLPLLHSATTNEEPTGSQLPEKTASRKDVDRRRSQEPRAATTHGSGRPRSRPGRKENETRSQGSRRGGGRWRRFRGHDGSHGRTGSHEGTGQRGAGAGG